MAQKDLFSRLKRLFSTNTIVRNIGGRKLKVVDTGKLQGFVQTNLVDRYQKLYSGAAQLQQYGYNDQLYQQQLRLGLFRDYESMDTDSIIASALDIYSDESTMKNEYGEVLTIQTDNDNIYDILHNLFYDIINIEFNLWPWVRNMNKYGDFFLQLEVADKYGIVNVTPMSAYDIARMEGHDPDNPQLVQFLLTPNTEANRHSGMSKDELTFENYEVAHFRLLSDSNYVPYGRSMLEAGRKVWKQLTLMEDAMLIHRIMRAPEKRVFKIDIGNIPPNEVENFMQRVINKMKKIPVIDQKTGDYNLRYNIDSTTEDYFLPVRGGDSGTMIDTLPGLTNDNAIEDIEYLRNKMMAALKVPKAFLGYEEGVGSKATLAAEDVRFARTIERLQKIVCAELEKIAIVHLYTQGFEDAELLNFELKLTNPSMIHQQEKLELLSQQQEIANNLMENKLFSRKWIYDNIFELSDGEKKDVFDGVIDDVKQKFRLDQIETEGSDPAESGVAAGDEIEEDVEWGGDRRSGTGEKEYGNEYDVDDLKDATKYEREKYGKREFKGGSPLYKDKGSSIVAREGLLNSLQQKFGNNKEEKSILNENNIIDEELSE